MSDRRFRDRTEAGELLAVQLRQYAQHPDGLVLALPRGGVPVAAEIAQSLALPLEICLVRKLGLPEHPELAMGAIASDGIMVLNHQVIRQFKISRSDLLRVADLERQELERRRQLYQSESPLPLQNRLVILVDDGIATSSTLRAAIALISRQQPQRLVVAAPVAPPETCELIQKLVQEVVCLITPDPLSSIGQWYEDFSQTSDQEVCRLLAEARARLDGSQPPEFED
ncbi:MAG: phosphoribosyltransferase [Pegethrix bostrychoides GSE-TBD4-15B]|jgi:putative phosphoribosyl transferase|uniref:Phosphoribosyltransferase n=1 Tax=Pegethrix bostrychoides GSE-TBD4-15B TaxID=2839662 RepID=A0A951PCQ1_9CYAN|nr:phosphoribosyltransferase [Pegethrix bostrychoides GSE-TBD4-15B]